MGVDAISRTAPDGLGFGFIHAIFGYFMGFLQVISQQDLSATHSICHDPVMYYDTL